MTRLLIENPLLERVLWGNSLYLYFDVILYFCLTFFVVSFLHAIIKNHVARLAQKTSTEVDDIIVKVFDAVSPLFYITILAFVCSTLLTVSDMISRLMVIAMIIITVWQVVRIVDVVIALGLRKYLEESEDAANLENILGILLVIVKVALWVTAILLILSNLGVNITALVASMGIGGIAIAFAVKGILEDLFSSFSIYLDKPFTVGDTVSVGAEKGIVKKIGIKTTRMKSLATGEEIVMANTDLTTQKIHNFKKMTDRRVSFDLGVTYETPTKKLKMIPQIVEDVITAHDETRFSRAHFRSFDDSALRFSFLYYIESSEYDLYLRIHEEILFAIREKFEKEKIDMAYPTQTIHLQKG